MDHRAGNPLTLLASLNKGRANNFDFLRFVLATAVVASHCYALTCPSRADFPHIEPMLRCTHGQIAGGDLAVDGFFIISGFLITNSWQNSRRASDFLRKRLLRIYPGFFAAVLFGLLIVAPLGAENLHAYMRNQSPTRDLYYMVQLIAPQTLYVFSNWASHDQVNGSLWTIRYEFWCYLLIMGFGAVRLISRRSLILAIGILIYGLYIVQLSYHIVLLHGRAIEPFGAPNVYARFLTYFLVGILYYLYRDIIPRSRRLLALSLTLLLIPAMAGYGLVQVVPLCAGYIIFYIAFSKRLRVYEFARSGDLSYGVYLYAFPVQQLILYYIHKQTNPLVLFMAAYPVILLLSAASWHLIEKPFLKLKPRGSTLRNIENTDTNTRVDNSAAKPLH